MWHLLFPLHSLLKSGLRRGGGQGLQRLRWFGGRGLHPASEIAAPKPILETWPYVPWSAAPPACQYHALGLLYHVRKNDRLAVSKMISKFTRHGLKSPFAYCMMIRVASRQLEEEDGR